MTERFIEISAGKRQASCVARLLDDEAPRTAQAVWDELPLSGDAFHAKYARNEIYTLVPALAGDPPRENPTITPIPGDVAYFGFEPWQLAVGTHGYDPEAEYLKHGRVVDLALFYGRNNLLLNPDFGWVPGSVFATVVEGLEEMATAAEDMWRRGFEGETLSFRRLEGA